MLLLLNSETPSDYSQTTDPAKRAVTERHSGVYLLHSLSRLASHFGQETGYYD